MPFPRADFLKYDDLRAEVVTFVSGFKVSQAIPVDVEAIADIRLALDIVPVAGLRRGRDIDGYLSTDRTAIYVDAAMSEGPIFNRYRFTLAHEVGHWYLHEDLYEAVRKSGSSFVDFHNDLPEEQRMWYEWQAYSFAGLLLVPRDALELEVASAINHAKASGFNAIDPAIDAHRSFIAEWASKAFEVSPEVILRRGGYDGLWPKEVD